MSVVLVPRERNNEAFVAWLEENIAPQDSVRQPYVRKYGAGWNLTTVMVRCALKSDHIYWRVTIEDEHMAMLFALKWS